MTEALPTASWGRRVLALLVDWLASTFVAIVIVGSEKYGEVGSPASFVTLGVFVVESAIFTWLLGGSFGKVATGLRVAPVDGIMRPINPLRLLLRQVMVVLVVPPLVLRADGRGLHDVATGTTTVSADTFRALVAKAQQQGRRGR